MRPVVLAVDAAGESPVTACADCAEAWPSFLAERRTEDSIENSTNRESFNRNVTNSILRTFPEDAQEDSRASIKIDRLRGNLAGVAKRRAERWPKSGRKVAERWPKGGRGTPGKIDRLRGIQ